MKTVVGLVVILLLPSWPMPMFSLATLHQASLASLTRQDRLLDLAIVICGEQETQRLMSGVQCVEITVFLTRPSMVIMLELQIV